MRTIGGRYELCGVIASGGMATVHLARQTGAAGFARMVAVKQLHDRYARDPDFVAMFLDEARLVARIRHVNVVQTLDVVHERETGELFIVMEYVHGVTLHQVFQTSRQRKVQVAPAVAAAVMIEALHGLHEAHEARSETGEALGIVHRDVSPQNILIGVDGSTRVLDFGVAKAQERISSTHEGELKGKLSYMSSEQIGGSDVDRRTDVYAASVVMWELLAGRKLFGAGNEGAVLKQVLEAPVSPPSTFHPLVPASLDRVVMRGLSRDLAERWSTARELADKIRARVAPASAGEVSAWLRELCAETIGERDAAIAMIEAKSSTQNMAELIESIRSMGLAPPPSSRSLPSGRSTPVLAAPIPPNPASSASSVVPNPGPPAPVRVSPRGTLVLPPDIATSVSVSVAPKPPVVAAPPSARPALVATPLPEVTSTRTAAAISSARPKPASSGAGGALVIAAVLLLGLGGAGLLLGSRYFAKRRADTTPVVASAASSSAEVAPPVPSTCPEGMVRIEGGNFFMGSDDGADVEKPAHHVKIHALCIDRFEVTANAYRACSDRGDCKRAPVNNRFDGIVEADHKLYDPLCTGADPARGTHPINCVDWDMAERFCRAEKKRLPTEAEWEFAARGSDGRKFPWGDTAAGPTLLNACGRECEQWFKKNKQPSPGSLYPADDGWPNTAPVGSFPKGAARSGAEDMAGNVWEWVADLYGPYTGDDQSDPTGPTTGSTHVIRGGAWNGSSADWLRPTFRFHASGEVRSYGTGLRCAMSLP